MRSTLFNILFYAWTAKTVLIGNVLLLLPGDRHLRAYIHHWAKGVRWLMRQVAGISIEFRGAAHMPPPGAALLAGKHQSYADGIIISSLLPNVAAVTHDGLLKYPLLGPVLRRLGAILVDTCGSNHGRAGKIESSARKARAAGRAILIYPEGRLMPVGEAGRYKTGIYHLYTDLQLPVTPIATNLGRCWVQNRWVKRPGLAVVEFLEPIAPGLSRRQFMAELERRIEGQTRLLEAESASNA